MLVTLSVAVLLIGLSTVDSQNTSSLNCNFVLIDGVYTCRISSASTSNDENAVIEITGSHQPGQSDEDVEVVEIFSSNIPFIVTQLFTTFGKVRSLFINRGGLVKIQANAFATASDLKTVTLMNNNLEIINEYAFNGAYGLEKLDIWQCQLKEINENAFRDLPSLRTLKLDRNQIQQLPLRVFSYLSNLETVTLSRNLLTSLPSEILSNNQRLSRVSVAHNQLNSIGRNFLDEMKSLRSFNAVGNLCIDDSWNIDGDVSLDDVRSGLSDCFDNYPQEPIDLKCRFEYSGYGEYSCKLYDVEVLDESRKIIISGQHLDGNSDDDVKFLFIENSNTPFMIQELFNTFFNIERLRIRNCQLQSINIPEAVQLKVLFLQGNNIPQITNKMFAGQRQLDELKFEFANIKGIDEDAFEGHETIRGLDFTGNQITELLPKTFHSLKNLTYLDFAQNNITRIDDELLAQNTNLYALYFNYNEISEISARFAEAFKSNLKFLYLRQNICIDKDFEDIEEADWTNIDENLRTCFENFEELSLKLRPKVQHVN